MTTYAHAVSLDFVSVRDTKTSYAVPLMTVGRKSNGAGYIAGAAEGIVTVRGKAAKREVLLMDANSRDYQFVGRIWSDDNGHYMFTDLDPDKQYLIMARDYNKEFEPFAYDYVTPATDVTPDEQHALRESWTK